jgi:protein-tyrosine phosphatase
MIDLHCHLLPNLDDGPADWETTLRMLRIAREDGVRVAVTTPHWNGLADGAEQATQRFQECLQRIAGEGLDFQLHLGQEVILVPELLGALRSGTALPLAGSSYVLLETAQLEHGPFHHQALFQLQAAGYRIILAHPERVRSWHRSWDPLKELIERGCHVQVNAGSLLGEFGTAVRRAAEELLQRGWVSLLASDAHSDTARPPGLTEARQQAAAVIGEAQAEQLVQDHPARVLCNELLPYLDPEGGAPRRQRRRWFWPWS